MASWISRSDQIKFQTGLVLLCPRAWAVMQGPVPNADLVPDAVPMQGFTAIERFTRSRSILTGGEEYFAIELNFVYRAPQPGHAVQLTPGQIIGWFVPPVLPSTDLKV